MAKRPVFQTSQNDNLFKVNMTEFKFYPGFSDKQKKLSIKSLHDSFLNEHQDSSILEVSSNSSESIGIKLSAFNLKLTAPNNIKYPVEVLFQSSKVFEKGGPYRNILDSTSSKAKKDDRLKTSGNLIYFDYFGQIFSNNPKTYFYNWIYINALQENTDLAKGILNYDCFTDINFNMNKSFNCQAEACAIYVSLVKNNRIKNALRSPEDFLHEVYGKHSSPIIHEQLSLILS